MKRAKLFLTNAVDRLHKFCAQIPSALSSSVKPIFEYQRNLNTKSVTCIVHLPNDLDESLRRHASCYPWTSEAHAKKDAAFEAVVRLHKAGLINDHLVPLAVFDEEAAEATKEIEKRPNLVEVEGLLDIWGHIAREWKSGGPLYACSLRFAVQKHTFGYEEGTVMLASSAPFPSMTDLALEIDQWTNVQVQFAVDEDPLPQFDVANAEQVTRLILRAGLRTRVDPVKGGFPVLCMPYESMNDPVAWLEAMSGTVSGGDLLSVRNFSQTVEESTRMGIVRDLSLHGSPYFFLDVQQLPIDTSTESQEPTLKPACRVRKLPKRRDFMHSILPEVQQKQMRYDFIEFDNCTVDRLPAAWAYLSLTLPSIYHYISIHWVAEDLRASLFNQVFKREDLDLVLTAISTSQAREKSNYQRLEFLGDSLLKVYATLTLLVANPLWPEGYLSKAKDQMVSNSRLASIAQRLGLGKYILRQPFTGAKWRPHYIDDLIGVGQQETESKREVPTKTLADIVEALIGASWVAGGEESLLETFRIFFPSNVWRPSSKSLSELKERARMHACNFPESYMKQLSALVGHEFQTPSLMVEAVTPPGSSGIGALPSYQRLEFLGDALLDMAVTLWLWADSKKIREGWMHRIRTAAVNGPFLGFCALSQQIEVTTARPAPPSRVNSTATNGNTVEKLDGIHLDSQTTRKTLLSFLRVNRSTAFSEEFACMRKRFEFYAPQIIARLVGGGYYPWAELAALDPKKVASDMVESMLAAIVIDHGQLAFGVDDEGSSPSLHFLNKMGILPFIRTVLSIEDPNASSYDPYKVWHPCEELGFLSVQEKVEYVSWSNGAEPQTPPGKSALINGLSSHQSSKTSSSSTPTDSTQHCQVLVASRLVSEASGRTAAEARTRAAERAVDVLRHERASRKEKTAGLKMEDATAGERGAGAMEIDPAGSQSSGGPSSGTSSEQHVSLGVSQESFGLVDSGRPGKDVDMEDDEAFFDAVMSQD
jgi:dsRNA-specific ribonuclease